MKKKQMELLDRMVHYYLVSDYYIFCTTNPKTADLWQKLYTLRQNAIRLQKKYERPFYGGSKAIKEDLVDMILNWFGVRLYAEIGDTGFEHFLFLAEHWEDEMFKLQEEYKMMYKHDPVKEMYEQTFKN